MNILSTSSTYFYEFLPQALFTVDSLIKKQIIISLNQASYQRVGQLKMNLQNGITENIDMFKINDNCPELIVPEYLRKFPSGIGGDL